MTHGAHTRTPWRYHPGVRSDQELTRGERAADHMRNAMGSWGFVAAALLFLAGWMLGNRNTGFDPYPFILLNLVLSCIAALQGSILLIAARRQDQISGELAMHDFETDRDAATHILRIEELTAEIHTAVTGGPTTTTRHLGDGASPRRDGPQGPSTQGADS